MLGGTSAACILIVHIKQVNEVRVAEIQIVTLAVLCS